MRYALIAPLVALAGACTPLPDPNPDPRPHPPQPLPPIADAGPRDGADEPLPTACDRAGARLAELECRTSDGRPLWVTPEGKDFGPECLYAASQGRDWHPECLERIPDCSWLTCAYRGECC